MKPKVHPIMSALNISVLAAMLAALLAPGAAVAAPPPDRIHYQGVLRDSADNPLDGSHDMVFRFFDADVAGNEILVDTHDALGGLAVEVSGGLFGVDLGAGVLADGSGPGAYSSLTEVFRDHSATWVSIEVDGEVLSPRVEVISAGYALNADHLDGMDSTSFVTSESDPQVGVNGMDSIPKWDGTALVSGSIYDVAGSVGIGVAIPTAKLDVAGTLKVHGDDIALGNQGSRVRVVTSGLILQAGNTDFHDIQLQAGNDATDGRISIFGSGQMSFKSGNGLFSFGLADTASSIANLNPQGDFEITGDLIAEGNDITFGHPGATVRAETGRLVLQGGDSDLDDLLLQAGNDFTDGEISVAGDSGITFTAGNGLFSFRNGSTGSYTGELNGSGDLLIGGDLEIDGTLIKGPSASNFSIESFSSLHLQGDNHIRTMIDDDATTSVAEAAWYHDGLYNTTGQLAELQEDGDFRIGGTLSQNVAFDIAESFIASEPLEPGDVVRLDPERAGAVLKSTGADDSFVLGVISSRPGVLLGSAPFSPESLAAVWGASVAAEFEEARDRLRSAVIASYPEVGTPLMLEEELGATSVPGSPEHGDLVDSARAELENNIESLSLERFFQEKFVPVALAGRVPVKVDASAERIQPGDPLSPGPVPGVAIKADGSGPIIGTALEGLADGRGRLLAFVHGGSAGNPARIETVHQELTKDLQTRTPDPATGTQSMTGNLQVVLDAGADQQSRFSVFRDGDGESIGAEVMRIDEQGDLYLKGAVRPASMDVAEYFPLSAAAEPGDVLVADPQHPGNYRPASQSADRAAVGVVALQPGVLLGSGVERIAGSDPTLAAELAQARRLGDSGLETETWEQLKKGFTETHAAVALTGTVDVKVDAGYGAIRVGDLLTSSPTVGHAMRADDPVPGTILGKALESLDTGSGMVRMLVMLR